MMMISGVEIKVKAEEVQGFCALFFYLSDIVVEREGKNESVYLFMKPI